MANTSKGCRVILEFKVLYDGGQETAFEKRGELATLEEDKDAQSLRHTLSFDVDGPDARQIVDDIEEGFRQLVDRAVDKVCEMEPSDQEASSSRPESKSEGTKQFPEIDDFVELVGSICEGVRTATSVSANQAANAQALKGADGLARFAAELQKEPFRSLYGKLKGFFAEEGEEKEKQS